MVRDSNETSGTKSSFYFKFLKVVLYFSISSTVNMRVKKSIVLLINTRLEFSLGIKFFASSI